MMTIDQVLDAQEYAAAMAAINEVRQKRANEAALRRAIDIIDDAMDEALSLCHPAKLVEVMYNWYLDMVECAEDEKHSRIWEG